MAGSVSRNAALNLGVVSSDPMLGVEITQSLWKKKKSQTISREMCFGPMKYSVVQPVLFNGKINPCPLPN